MHTAHLTNICRPSEDAQAMFLAMVNIVLAELAELYAAILCGLFYEVHSSSTLIHRTSTSLMTDEY